MDELLTIDLYYTYTALEFFIVCAKIFGIVSILAGFKMLWDMRSTPVEEP